MAPATQATLHVQSPAILMTTDVHGGDVIRDLAGHWPAAVRRSRRLKLEIDRFEHSRYAAWNDAQLKSFNRASHIRVREQSYEELKLENERLEARYKAEAATARCLANQLHDCIADQKLPPKESSLCELLQQALVHGIDGALCEEEIVIRVRLSAAGLAAGSVLAWSVQRLHDAGRDGRTHAPGDGPARSGCPRAPTADAEPRCLGRWTQGQDAVRCVCGQG